MKHDLTKQFDQVTGNQSWESKKGQRAWLYLKSSIFYGLWHMLLVFFQNIRLHYVTPSWCFGTLLAQPLECVTKISPTMDGCAGQTALPGCSPPFSTWAWRSYASHGKVNMKVMPTPHIQCRSLVLPWLQIFRWPVDSKKILILSGICLYYIYAYPTSHASKHAHITVQGQHTDIN